MNRVFSMPSFFLIIVNILLIRHGLAHPDAYADCSINRGACVKNVKAENIQVVFDIGPKPVETMKELVFRVMLKAGDKPIEDARVTLHPSMPGMYMRTQKLDLRHREAGTYEGTVVLPRCPSGRKIWKADIAITREDKAVSVSYVFGVD